MDIFFDQVTRDISFSNGDLIITDNGVEKLVQRLFVRLKSYRRDLFWNPSYGIDYINDVFGKNRKKSVVDKIVRNEILKEEMVREIVSFESTIEGYAYACEFKVSLIDEPTIATFYILSTPDGLTLTDQDGNPLLIKLY